MEDHDCLFAGYSLTILLGAIGCLAQKCTGCVYHAICMVTSDFLSESKHRGGLKYDHISIGNWSNKAQGVS